MRLREDQLRLILEKLQLPDGLRARVTAALHAEAALTLDEADALRDLCGERLQTHGFGASYELTEEGVALEELIDALFNG